MTSPALAFTDSVGPAEADYLVLGHSLGTCAGLWADAIPLLAESFRVVCWELPGHGDSPPAAREFTIGDLSDAIVRRLGALTPGPFLYAGVSIAGTVGIDLALRHGARVGATTIISSGARVDSPDAWIERAASVREHGTESLADGSLQRWFAPATREHRAEQAERMIDALRTTDDESYALACEALAAYDATVRLPDIEVPVMAVWGQHDQLVPERRSVELARHVRRGAVRSVPDAAHASPIEQPAAVAHLLTAFFRTR